MIHTLLQYFLQRTTNLWQKVFLHDILAIGFLFLLCVWVGHLLLQPGLYFNSDPSQILTLRQMAVETCIKSFQLPCRWSFNMGYGYGMPYFNYYPILPYIFGELFRLVRSSFVSTIQYSFFASILFSSLAMYIFGRSLWGRLGGFVSAAAYILVPYHNMDIFARSALNEA